MAGELREAGMDSEEIVARVVEVSPGGVFHDGDLLRRQPVKLADGPVDLPVGRLDLGAGESRLAQICRLRHPPVASEHILCELHHGIVVGDVRRPKASRIGESLLLWENYKFAGMKTKELILREIEVFPEPYLKEVLDFVRFLKDKSSKRGIEAAILSEPVLAKEWLAREEEEAWEDL